MLPINHFSGHNSGSAYKSGRRGQHGASAVPGFLLIYWETIDHFVSTASRRLRL